MLNDYKDLWLDIEKAGLPQDILQKIFEKINQERVSNYVSANELRETKNFALTNEASDLETVKTELLNYMDQAINTQSPYFINQLYGGTHPIAVISEWVNAFMNTSMATYEIAPLATLFEHEIIQSLSELMGWSAVDGIMVPGGSYANMMALHLSRFRKDPNVKVMGTLEKNVVYISDQAHYSVKKAAHLLGYGENQVRIIASDKTFKMKVDVLEAAIKKDLENGLAPTLVVSTLGTTVFGAVDPINDIQKVCQLNGLWHHVDGAWGGPLVFSSADVQAALKSVDSVTFDFHKLLGGALTKAIFVTKNQNLMSEANSCVGTQYIFHEDEDSFFDTGTKAIQCGRKVDALSLWMTWKFLGHDGFKAYVNKQLELKNYVVGLVEKYDYKILHNPEYLNVCFRVPLKGLDSNSDPIAVNTFQKELRRQLVKDGLVFVNYSSTEQHGVFIRLVLNHLRITEQTLDKTFEIISATADQILNKKTNDLPKELTL